MSAGEVAVIASLAGLVGVAIGVSTTALLTWRCREDIGRRTRLIEAYTGWLAARMTAGRASFSFVAAFRALAVERSDYIYFPLRTDEAQRARAYWCDAMKSLDLAEATLIALDVDDSDRDPRDLFFRVGPDALRRAINGDEADVDMLAHELRAADRLAVDFVRNIVVGGGKTRGGAVLNSRFVRTLRQLRAIVGRWSDEP